METVIPPNTTAEIIIPYGTIDNLSLNGSDFKENANLKLQNSEGTLIKITANPGTYQFRSKL